MEFEKVEEKKALEAFTAFLAFMVCLAFASCGNEELRPRCLDSSCGVAACMDA